MFLIIVTTISLAAAGAFGWLAWRLHAENRRRSAARVAALGAAIDAADADTVAGPSGVAGHTELFHAAGSPAMQGRPLLKVAIGFTMAVAVIVFAAMSGDQRAEPGATTTIANYSLELLSMRHQRVGDTLTVTGLVRNAGTTDTGRLTAVVFAFDANGGFLASGRAPVEFNRLGPGDESPFQITIGRLPEVGRYRVSFRDEAGALRHVDRRAEPLRAALGGR